MNAQGAASRAPSVDPGEAARFERLARQWWDVNGPLWPLHLLNDLRVPWILDQLCERHGRDPDSDLPLRGLDLLDVGCGGGILSESMADYGARVHGIDVVESNILVAREHAQRSRLDIRYDVSSVEALAARGVRYDGLLNMEVVEHVADLEGFMSACCGLLRPRGLMVLATINRTPMAWVKAIVGAEYVLRLLPKGTHAYEKFRKPVELDALLMRDGIEVRDRIGVTMNPLTRSFSFTPSLKVNYMMSASRSFSVASGGTG